MRRRSQHGLVEVMLRSARVPRGRQSRTHQM